MRSSRASATSASTNTASLSPAAPKARSRMAWCGRSTGAGRERRGPGPSASRAHVVVEGECVIRPAAAGGVALKSGELAYLPRGDAHVIGDPLEAEARPLSALVKSPVAGEMPPIAIGGNGRATRWISL